MSTLCPKTLSITVSNPVIPPIVYYKLDVIGVGNAAVDSGPYGLDTNTNAGVVTLVPGIIGNAHMWDATAVRYRTAPDVHLNLNGLSWTVRVWVKFNALPVFTYNYPFGLDALTFLRLASKGVGGSLPIPGSDSECRPYFAWNGGWVWADQGNTNSVLKDLAWHRVVVRYDLAGNTVGIAIDNGADDTAITGGAFPGIAGIAPRMSGPDSHGAPANDLSSCECGIWPYRWSDAEKTADWNGGAGVTYP